MYVWLYGVSDGSRAFGKALKGLEGPGFQWLGGIRAYIGVSGVL